ncbi:MoaD/ThiS family protein [Flavobacteriaceae bacterium R38]|nr:MoaD/ThiS family protein [Flavobacteriaceae bacterium R38]
MSLTIKYFGMLAEVTKCNEELIEVNECTIKELTSKLLEYHPDLKSKNFKVAVNQSLVDEDILITSKDEIALLPPFAGG